MSVNDIVNVQISRETRFPTEIAFGTPLILSQHTAFLENYREYTDIDAVADDFATSSDEYKAATAVFSQNPSVTKLRIGRKLANVAEENRITPVAVNLYTYEITVRGTRVTYTADASATVPEIIAGFIAALGAIPDITPSDGTTYLKILATTAGLGLGTVVGEHLTNVIQTANVGAESALNNISNDSDDFYGVMCCSRTAVDVKACAAWAEPRMKLFVTASGDANILSIGSTTDIAYVLKAAGYDRTVVLYSADYAAFPDAAVLGMALPYDPGSITFKFKELNGITADNLTDTQRSVVFGKNCNVFDNRGGLAIIENGTCASGEFADVIMGIDWIGSQIQERVYAMLANEPKVPYTNQGVDAVKAQIRGVLIEAVSRSILRPDPVPTVTAPDVQDISVLDRGARLLPDITFLAQLAGAVHSVIIRGTLTV